MVKFVIRKAAIVDVELIKRLEIESKLSPWTVEDYYEELKREESVFLIIRCNSKFCGFLLARLITNFQNDLPETVAEIYNIAIEKEYRRHKLGTKILGRLIKEGTRNNLKKIFLEVRKSNTEAIKFYEKNKFIQSGIRKNFYSNPTEDAVLMYLIPTL